MFGKEPGREPAKGSGTGEGAALSIVASGMVVRGDIESSGIVKVDGRVEGGITSQRQIMVGRGAHVSGDLTADEVVVAGTVTGNVRARSRLELQGSAVVAGDLSANAMVVMEGARINGSVTMQGATGAVAITDRTAPAIRAS